MRLHAVACPRAPGAPGIPVGAVLDFVAPDPGEGGDAPFVTVVWLHGGGLTGGEREIPPELIAPAPTPAVTPARVAVAGAGYRLAPRARYPDYLVDAAAAVAWALDHVAEYGGDPRRVYCAGHSAGAYLAAMVGLDARWLEPFGHAPIDLAGLLLASGSTVTHFQIRAERGKPTHRVTVDADAPLYHVSRHAPPVFLVAGGAAREVPGRAEEARLFEAMLRLAGHPHVHAHYDDAADHGATAALACRLFRDWLDRGVWPA